MLLPNHDELLALRNQTNFRGLDPKAKVKSPSFGGHRSLFKGRGLDFAEFREYTIGDDIRSIDWRVTARTGKAHTKIFTEERERSVYVIVDLNSYMDFGTRKTFKSVQAAKVAALIAWSAHDLGDKTGAILFGSLQGRMKVLAARRSRRSIWEMLKALCSERKPLAEVKVEEALEQARRHIKAGSAVFIISDFYNVSDQFEKSLGLLSRGRDITLVKITDPADKNMPQANVIRFSNAKGASLKVNTNDLEGVQTYRQNWNQADQLLQEIVRKFRARLVRITTNGDLFEELFGYRSLESQKAQT
jgi:uncharacterized protein (DUF58 family)